MLMPKTTTSSLPEPRLRRTPGRLLLIVLALALMLHAGCTAPGAEAGSAGSAAPGSGAPDAAGSTAEPDIMAEIGGQTITRAELENEVLPQLRQLDLQRHQILEQALERLIADRVLQAEAARSAQSVDAILAASKDAAAVVSEADVDRFYAANQARIREPKAAIASQIKAFLADEAQRKARAALVSRLRAEQQVAVYLRPLRMAVDDAAAPSKGPADAPVTLVEFLDFQCPPCRQLVPAIERVVDAYPEKLRVVYRNFPLPAVHPQAQQAAEIAWCARQQAPETFWVLHDAMFAHQDQLGREALIARSRKLGLDGDQLESCLASGRAREAVAADLRAGELAGVSGTPSVYVNGRPVALLRGQDPFITLSSVIDEELARATAGEG